MIPLDIWKIIFNKLDFKSQLSIISLCTYFKKYLFITDLYNINRKYLNLLTNDILKYKIFMNTQKLNTDNNRKITDVSFMKSLKVLCICGYYCGINQYGIQGLELNELDIMNNNKIYNVSFMKSLKILNVSGVLHIIGQSGIQELELNELVEKKLKQCFNFF